MNNLPTETIKEILGMVPDKTATHYDASCGYYWKITSPDGDSEEIYCFSEAEGLWIEEEYSYAEHNLNDLREILTLRLDNGAKQAQIDRLMLEYCPDEMTDEQLKVWESSQQPPQEKSE